ncbi:MULTISPECIES: hypothetical protein [Lysinibacillus]|uniref:hypothetical protein n=1 Tax=Lysinibacillus TaxID=400634 RepID=UPI00214B3873|nr:MULTISPECIES: hypothetical protein [Lysinibacillus]UUV25953.1 hypothetical protein NP781_04855 [Lysinibacillus sp. FN11]UYB48826.1 hypothetical protein OCI51_07645 [Lysinibacillus capsici]
MKNYHRTKMKLRGKRRKFKNKKTLIPKGLYCYEWVGEGGDIKYCPFWRVDKANHYQSNGVCLAFNKRDDESYGGLLWDKVKECDINDDV